MRAKESKYAPLTKEEEHRLWQISRDESLTEAQREEARNRILCGFYPYLCKVAQEVAYSLKRIGDWEDCLNVAIIKVMKEYWRWEPSKGRSYTYLGYIAKREMRSWLTRKNLVIALPGNHERADKTVVDYSENEQRSRDLMTGGLDKEDYHTMEVLVTDHRTPAPEDRVHLKMDLEDLERAMAWLKHKWPRHHFALYQRVWREKTLVEVGEMMGLTKERVRQICVKGIKSLRVRMGYGDIEEQEVVLDDIVSALRKSRNRQRSAEVQEEASRREELVLAGTGW